jgi:hypothetical protein
MLTMNSRRNEYNALEVNKETVRIDSLSWKICIEAAMNSILRNRTHIGHDAADVAVMSLKIAINLATFILCRSTGTDPI